MLANPTNDRLKFILKTYGEKKPWVVYDMVRIIANTVGADDWATRLEAAAFAAGDQKFLADLQHLATFPGGPTASKQPSFALLSAVVDMVCLLPQFKTRHRADPLFPWMAQKIAANRTDALASAGGTYGQDVSRLRRTGTVLAQWYERTRPNLGEYDLDTAIREAKEWNETEGPVPQGEVVVQLSDGWTGQKLTTKEQLDAEGNRMQHCVGSYAREVKGGRTTIYSLRDEKGRPHVTIEVKNDRVQQIKGKQNDTPAPKYQPYVEEFKTWLEENDISTAKYPASLLPYVEAIEQHAGDGPDEEHMEMYARDWQESVGSAEDTVAWFQAGMSYSDYELASLLEGENVTPDEYASFPYAVHRLIHETGGVPRDLDDLVAVARMTNLLVGLAPKRDSADSIETPQTELFARETRVAARVPGHDPVGDRKTRHGSMAQPRLSGGFWDEWDRYGADEGLPWLYPAEEWLAEKFTSDSSDDEYVAPWFIHRFTPEQATEWWDAGVESGDLAHELRRRRIRPEMFQGDSPPAVHRSLTEFENLKAKADREWLRRTAATPEEKAASEARRDADLSRYAKAVAQQIAEQFDEDGVKRNPKRTAKRTSRRR